MTTTTDRKAARQKRADAKNGKPAKKTKARGKAKPKPQAAPVASKPAETQPSQEPEGTPQSAPEAEQPPEVGASVNSIAEARARRDAKNDDPSSVPTEEEAKAAFADMDVEPIELPMEQLDALTLENLDHRVKREQRRVAEPIKAAFQAKLTAAITKLQNQHQAVLQQTVAKSCAADEKFKEARAAQVDAINTAIDKYTELLPEGHAVNILNPEEQKIVSKYDPDGRGQKLEVPGEKKG